MNRIDEFADALLGWMAEWESSRKSGKYSQKGGCPDVGVSALPSDAKGSSRLKFGAVGSPDQLSSGRSDAPANSHGTTACCESAPIQFGRCGESAESELNKADTAPAVSKGHGSYALSNTQRPIQDSCGDVDGSHGNGCASPSTVSAGAITPAVVRGTPPAGMNFLSQSQELASVDELPNREYYDDDEPYWSDSLTTLERYGRGGK